MTSTPTQQPVSQKPRRSRWLKGCLILLLLPFLILGILYVYLLCIPTGYDEQKARASRAAREKILAARLAPRPTVSPVGASDASFSLPTTVSLNTPISPEEARFWGKIKWRLKSRSGQFTQYDINGGSRSVPPDELSFDPEKNTHQLSPKNTQAFEQGRQKWDVDRIRGRLRGIQKGTVSGGDDPSLIKEGTETVKEMNKIERFLLEEEGDRGNSSENPLRDPRNMGEIVSNPTLTVYRAIRDGDREKAVRLIERFVLESGECIFSDSDSSGVSQRNRMADLERFLSWLASDPRVPEETLEWAAVTLASWKLAPQEYMDLRAASVNQGRAALLATLQETIGSEPEGLRAWIDQALLRGDLRKIIKPAVTPILHRAIDVKTAAIIRQDGSKYEKGQWMLYLSLKGLGLSEERGSIPRSITSGNRVSYEDLLLKDGLAYTPTGESLQDFEKQSRKCPPGKRTPSIPTRATKTPSLPSRVGASRRKSRWTVSTGRSRWPASCSPPPDTAEKADTTRLGRGDDPPVPGRIVPAHSRAILDHRPDGAVQHDGPAGPMGGRRNLLHADSDPVCPRPSE
jgi:hypothetical protein